MRGRQAALGRDGRLLLTTGETASRLNTGPLGIERLIEEGLLEPAESDERGRIWFDPVDVDAVAQGRANRGSGPRLRGQRLPDQAAGSFESSENGEAPEDDDPMTPGRHETGRQAASQAGRMVILVDDDDELRATNALVLEREGYRVCHARDGAEALTLLKKSPEAALIVLDLHMPTMDGWAFRRAQLEDEDLRPIPVLVLTADPTCASEAIGAAALLLKPAEPSRFLASVREQLAPKVA